MSEHSRAVAGGPDARASAARTRAPRWLDRLPALLVLLVLGAACERQAMSPDALPPGALVLRQGASLFDHGVRMEVTAWPESCLPPGIARRVAQLWGSAPFELRPEQWIGGAPTPLPDVSALGLDPTLPTRRFRISPPVRLDLAAGRPWLTHAGRRLRRVALDPLGLQMQWVDPEGAALFWWDESRGDLVVLSVERPRLVGLGYEPDADFGLSAFERVLATGARPARASAVSAERDVLRVYQRTLAAPAGSSFELSIDRLEARELVLSCALPDTGLRWEPSVADPGPGVVRDERSEGRRLERAARRSDGMVFGVSVCDERGRWQRIWARRVQTVDGWVEARLDLSAWTGRSLRLALETETDGDAHSDFDHGLWAGLRLEDFRAAAPSRPDLVLVVLSHWRPDRSSPWDSPRDSMPQLALWAADAQRFDDVLAPSSLRLSAQASLLSGRWPGEHGLSDLGSPPAALPTSLAAHLAAAGYETRAVLEGGELVPDVGLAAGFERVLRCLPGQARAAWLDEARRLAGARGARPVLLVLQADGPQAPWPADERFGAVAPAPFAGLAALDAAAVARAEGSDGRLSPSQVSWLRGQYDGALTRADALLGDLLEELRRGQLTRPGLVAVLGDTGQALAERGRVFSDRALDPEDLRVPLLVRWPGARAGLPAVDSRPRSTLDLAPTLLQLAGVTPPADLPGTPLDRAVPTERPRLARDRAGRDTVVSGDWQLVREGDGSLSLFAWPGGVGRRPDVAAAHPDVVAGLAEQLPQPP